MTEEINKLYGPKDTPSDLDNEHHKRKPDIVPPLPDVHGSKEPVSFLLQNIKTMNLLYYYVRGEVDNCRHDHGFYRIERDGRD